jgi:hypothetical protein
VTTSHTEPETVYGKHGEVYLQPYANWDLLQINITEYRNVPTTFSASLPYQVSENLSSGSGSDIRAQTNT